jgi:putative transposase
MNTREVANEYRLSRWAGIMQERKESGQSVAKFCETAGFHENTYYYWQRKLREAACKGLLPQQGKPADGTAPNGWVVCGAAEPNIIERGVYIEIGKARVMATAETAEALLSKVCRVLAGIC